jgi:hypothetical protein
LSSLTFRDVHAHPQANSHIFDTQRVRIENM